MIGCEVLIIGGGISGMLTARELSEAGLQVTLLEREFIGRESSWAGGGILSPLAPWEMPDAVTALCRWSQRVYPSLAAELLKNTGMDPEWTQCGLIIRNCEQLDRAIDWCTLNQVAYEYKAIAESDPPATLYFPEVAHIRNPRLLQALRTELEKRGVKLLEQQAVRTAVIHQNRIVSVNTDRDEFGADNVILTIGAWMSTLDASFEAKLPIQPIKGQMLVFAAIPGLLRHILMSDGKYLIPRRDGHILVGSTVEQAGFNKDATEQAYQELTQFAYTQLPVLQNYPVEKHWAGLRPGSPQGIPYIGVHPRLRNLYINCGHYRNGLVMAPASARLLADTVLGRDSEIDASAYRIP